MPGFLTDSATVLPLATEIFPVSICSGSVLANADFLLGMSSRFRKRPVANLLFGAAQRDRSEVVRWANAE